MESKKYCSVAADDAENADAAVCAEENSFFRHCQSTSSLPLRLKTTERAVAK